MSLSLKLPCCAAAVLATACLLPAVSGAQSLSLSYKLDPVPAAATERVAPVVDRCSGLNWGASLVAGCIVQEAGRAAPPPQTEPVAYTGATVVDNGVVGRRVDVPVGGSEAPAYELPTLGSPTGGRLLKVKDLLAGAANKTVDFLFRFGSKYRMKSGDEGWEIYKFTDIATENRLSGTSPKNVGVELFVPFQ